MIVIVNNGNFSKKQVVFPRSKGRRIRKKWSKRPCNFFDSFVPGPPDGMVWRMGDTFVMSSKTLIAMKEVATISSRPDYSHLYNAATSL